MHPSHHSLPSRLIKNVPDQRQSRSAGLKSDRLLVKFEPAEPLCGGQFSTGANTRRIWLNLELIKKPVQCLEYIVVHELAHLMERQHNDRFAALMDHYLPDWRLRRDLLNKSPLAHEAREY